MITSLCCDEGVRSAYRETDPEKQKALYAEFVTASLVPHLMLVEKHLAANGSGHLVGDSVSIVFSFRK